MKTIFINILRIFSKSMLATLIIGYFIFNLVYIMNDCPPYKNNILSQRCEDSIELHQKNVVLDQGIILSSYVTWIKKAVFLDFGPKKYRSKKQIFPQVIDHFQKTFKLIFGSLFIAFLLSIIIYKLSFYEYIKKFIIDPFISASFLHLCIFIFLLTQFTQSSGTRGAFDDLVVCFIMILSNGILYDYFSLLKDDHDMILKKDYSIFAKHSGYQQYVFASKELIISFIYITISRIPILFASMTILEVLSKGKYFAIGYDIWKYFATKDTNYAAFFGSTFMIVLFFTFLYFMAEHLRLSLSPKLNKT